EGEAGMGKSALWTAAIEQARHRSWSVLTSRPTDVEAVFAYAGLADLLGAIPEATLDALPAPQRRALRVALLLDDPEDRAPEVRAIAVAFLGVLRGMARVNPTLVAVDDCQWLDRPSAVALTFAMRRIADDRVSFLLAQRADGLPAADDRDHVERPGLAVAEN